MHLQKDKLNDIDKSMYGDMQEQHPFTTSGDDQRDFETEANDEDSDTDEEHSEIKRNSTFVDLGTLADH